LLDDVILRTQFQRADLTNCYLGFSSNTFFYQVGVGVGSKALKQAADQLGFQQKTGIEIGWEESVGLVGDEDWAALGRGWTDPGTSPWIPEDMASASIGQSVVQITPLQLARAYAVFANGGWLVTPHLAAREIDWRSPEHRSKVVMKPSTLQTIREVLITPGLAALPLIRTARLWLWPLPRTPLEVDLFTPCRWPRRCWRSGRGPVSVKPL